MVITTSSTGKRPGWTLVELLIVIVIIAILMSFLLVTVQMAMESANLSKCQSNLRQIGKAIAQFSNQNSGYLPTNGGPQPGDISTGAAGTWGVANNTKAPRDQSACWAYQLLPFLGLAANQQSVSPGNMVGHYEAPAPIYMCPTRGRYQVQWAPATDAISGQTQNTGGRNPWCKTDYAANWWLFVNRYPSQAYDPYGDNRTLQPFFRMEDITRGASQTIMIGEKCMDTRLYGYLVNGVWTGGWLFDEPIFAGGCAGFARSGPSLVRDASNWQAGDDPYGINGRTDYWNVGWEWGSAHFEGGPFLFADGTVQVLKYNIDSVTMSGFLAPNRLAAQKLGVPGN